MPPLEDSDLVHTAVVFDNLGYDKYNRLKVGNGREVDCRWQWGRKQTVNSKGVTISLDAQVVIPGDEEVALGSVLYLGTLGEMPTGTGEATWTDVFLMKVETYTGGDDLKGNLTRQQLGLVWLEGTPPRIV